MLAFVFALATASEDTKFCVYKKNKELCKPEYGKAISEKKAEDEITNKGLNPLNTYVYVVESVPKAKVDIHHIKDANIFVIGIGKQPEIMFISSNIATYDYVSLKNIVAVKKDTTQFAIKKMELENVLFSGFEKASTFYGNDLISDLNSVAQTTFKFTTVLIKVGEPKKFTPNWKVDGAIFCEEVTFDEFGKNASVFQYGDQLIITPVNESMGYRRTNFRPIYDDVKFIIKYENPGKTLTVGSWFMNRHSAFQNTEFHLKDSTLHFVGYKWSTYHNITIYSENSTIINDATRFIMLNFQSFKNSHFETSFDCTLNNIRTSYIVGSTFKGVNQIRVANMYVDCDFKFNMDAKLFVVSKIITEKKGAVIEVRGCGTRIGRTDENLGKIIVDKLNAFSIITNIDENGQGCVIEADEAEIYTKVFVEIYRPLVLKEESFPEFVPILKLANNTEKYMERLESHTRDTIFPCKLSIQGDTIGILKSEFFSKHSLNICFTDDENDNCNFTTFERITDNSKISLATVLQENGLPDYVYALEDTKLYIVNNMAKEVKIDTDFNISGLIAQSNNRGKFFLTNGLNRISSATFRSCNLNGDAFKCNGLHLFDVDMKADLAAAKFEGLVLQCDVYSYDQLKYVPTSKRLEIYTKYINFTQTEIYPNVPISDDITVSFYDVEFVNGGQGGFKKNFTSYLYPAKTINFTTNSYGGLYFEVISNLINSRHGASPTIDIYYKAVLPVNIKNNPNMEFRLHPNFLGEAITMSNTFCGKNMNVSLAGMERIKFSGKSLMCSTNTVNLNIPNRVEMKSSYLSGNIYVPSLTIDRQIYLNEGTYLKVDEFSNPDDDFLLYFTWTLSNMPFFNVKHFTDSKSTSFDPSIQTYAVPTTDAEFFMSHEVYNFGIPFVCIYDTEYKGYIFSDGLIFQVNNTSPNATAIFHKIGMEAAGDVCSYLIPYRPEPPHVVNKGPDNPIPWFVICAICGCLFFALLILIAISFLKGFKKKEEPVEFSEMEQPTLMMDLINTT